MEGKMFLLVEDNRDDEALNLRALKKNNSSNKPAIVRDRDRNDRSLAILLDLNLPKVDGLVLNEVPPR